MTELKTLKNLKLASDKYTKKKLKAEAIKWVKEWEKQIKESEINVELTNEQKAGYEFRINNFKHFFNLTEEDLK